ncbi:Uu.00g090360.m01.CDS01 [Anthostomella pinea]|uniref:Uu.00g090360.m01.CDS01 n=1 Tax=Anthostomella pinea TaxID=933095 RepID=A0AAI8VMW7_9PEZI|nr:Uu.00g090360.m01.CDS01 [Anthostomella pinea]
MGRRRIAAKSARLKHAPILEQARESDLLPKSLVNFLHALPRDTTPPAEADERPAKRARVEVAENAEHPKAITIARESFTLARPSREDTAPDEHGALSWENAGEYVRVQFSERTKCLTISSRPKSPYGAFKAEIFLSQPNFSRAILTTLEVLNQERNDEPNGGALVVKTHITLDKTTKQDHLRFSFELNWKPATIFPRHAAKRALSQLVMDTFFGPAKDSNISKPLQPQDFYEAAFMPDDSHTDLSSIRVPGLDSKLYPFQRRAVQWLLMREGVKYVEEGPETGSQLVPHSVPSSSGMPLSVKPFTDADGRSAFVSNLYHMVARDITPFRQMEASINGGILAEEMGLGKTVEIISLILMHKRSRLPHPPEILDLHTGQKLHPTGATLIVVPGTLKDQWFSEVQKHAPGLREMEYHGLKSREYRKRFQKEGPDAEARIIAELAASDIVITTYNVLQSEIHYAGIAPDRNMRQQRQHNHIKSPLLQMSWWRVCLDEAQMIERGVSNAATLARMIPRVNAWGITGTPVKDSTRDLLGLLQFLRYDPFASSQAIWHGLLTSHQDLFFTLFNQIALRHSKRAVRHELSLPPQKRFVVTMPFTAIEEQNYQAEFGRRARSFGLNELGCPLEEDWDPDDPNVVDLMKRALAGLRQTVLHPGLGPGGLPVGAQKNKPLRTIDEVLDAMIDQSDFNVKTEQRTWLISKLKRAQLLDNSPRVREALAIWEEVREDIQSIVAECRKELEAEVVKAKQAELERRLEEVEAAANDNQGKTEANTSRVGEYRRRLRSALDIEHRVVFFIASAHYQIKSDEDMTKPGSDKFTRLERRETEGYERAKEIRREILQEPHAKVSGFLSRTEERAKSQSFVEIPEIKSSPHRGLLLRSRNTLEGLEKLGTSLNVQANLIDEWREHVIQLLLKPLVDAEPEEVTGDEYEDSTKIQEDLMVYTLALRAVIADRQDALSGSTNERVRYDTQFAERQAKNGEGDAPEKVLSLLRHREEVRPQPQGSSLRTTVAYLKQLVTDLRDDTEDGSLQARIELDIVLKQLKLSQQQLTEHTKVAASLERELDQLTSAMNARVEFYKQLQAVSDTVAPGGPTKEADLMREWNVLQRNEQDAEKKLALMQSNHRYLLHLKEAGRASNGPQTCVICQFDFTLGVLTICGHQFCKDCMMTWWKAHRNCPLCKTKLGPGSMHDITLKKQELKLHQEQPHNPDNPQSRKMKKTGIYSEFSKAKLDAIQNIKLQGPSYGTKIDTIIKHLLWSKQEDPGSKTIVFSQFRKFLDVLNVALARQPINYSTFNHGGIDRFQNDPMINCLLMPSNAYASGLNLVVANHVFLCEPMINTALELQAIARVNRIGQKLETTVWLYLVEGTVEESVYNLSVQRRLKHIGESGKGKGKEKETPGVSDLDLEDANSMELQQAALAKLMNKDKDLGEVVDKNDLWECLFGHLDKSGESAAGPDERGENPAIVGFLAAEAAEERRLGNAGGEAEAGPST